MNAAQKMMASQAAAEQQQQSEDRKGQNWRIAGEVVSDIGSGIARGIAEGMRRDDPAPPQVYTPQPPAPKKLSTQTMVLGGTAAAVLVSLLILASKR